MDAREQADALAARLPRVHARVRALDAPDAVRQQVLRRLLALTDASKTDVVRAAARLDRLEADLDAGRVPVAEDDEPGH